ncbi:MAG TPA: hypothetical protein VK599_22595 [Streptosporangiaceae bacterium]|nr:hypothetical protein [Streptosporangiaceae bacterium]
MTSPFIAPAAKVFTEAHLPGGDGRTACGIECAEADLWMPVELRPGDRVHQACLAPELFTQEQGALL